MCIRDSLLSGFANPGLITVIALLIMAEGMVATGAISSIAKIFELENKLNSIVLFSIILICVAVLSSVMNNTPIVVYRNRSDEEIRDISISKLKNNICLIILSLIKVILRMIMILIKISSTSTKKIEIYLIIAANCVIKAENK